MEIYCRTTTENHLQPSLLDRSCVPTFCHFFVRTLENKHQLGPLTPSIAALPPIFLQSIQKFEPTLQLISFSVLTGICLDACPFRRFEVTDIPLN
jgi:hypothetical protein